MSIMLQRRGALLLGSGLLAGLAIISGADAQKAKYKEAPALAEQVKAGKLPSVEKRLPWIPWSFQLSSGPASTAACGAAPSSGPPTSTITCGSSTTRSAASRRTAPRSSRRSPRAGSRRRTSRSGRSSSATARAWSDGAPFTADDMVFWHKDVILNKDLTPSIPGWLRNSRRHRGVRREGRRPDGALHVQAAGDALPDRARQPGRR